MRRCPKCKFMRPNSQYNGERDHCFSCVQFAQISEPKIVPGRRNLEADRARIAQQVEEFLQAGGEIQHIESEFEAKPYGSFQRLHF